MTSQSVSFPSPSLQIPSLRFIFWTFLRIGSISFGGHMSLVSVVEKELVDRYNLLTHKDILDGTSLANFLPGPIPVNVVAYAGYRLRGGWGSFVSLVGVILPSFLLITGLAIAYFSLGQISAANNVFLGFIPAVTAIIVSTAWRMSLREIKGWREILIAVVSALLLIGVGGAYMAQIIIICSGFLGVSLFGKPHANDIKNNLLAIREKQPNLSLKLKITAVILLVICTVLAYIAPLVILEKYTILKIFVTFAGISVRLFGGAYVGIPFMQEVIVQNHRWLTEQEFTSALAMGQVTPGPIAISAAFIGYKVGGFLGALAATAGIFAPTSVLIVISTQILERMKDSASTQAALRGIRPAAIGMIFAAAWVIWNTAAPHWLSPLIFMTALFALIRFRVSAVWVIPIGGLGGLFLD